MPCFFFFFSHALSGGRKIQLRIRELEQLKVTVAAACAPVVQRVPLGDRDLNRPQQSDPTADGKSDGKLTKLAPARPPPQPSGSRHASTATSSSNLLGAAAGKKASSAELGPAVRKLVDAPADAHPLALAVRYDDLLASTLLPHQRDALVWTHAREHPSQAVRGG